MTTSNGTGRAGAATHRVVRNDEGQYSTWPAFRGLPVGWSDEGPAATREECLARIDAAWRDMRPASLRAAARGT